MAMAWVQVDGHGWRPMGGIGITIVKEGGGRMEGSMERVKGWYDGRDAREGKHGCSGGRWGVKYKLNH